MNKRYSDLKQLSTFEERFNYLKINGSIGIDTFGFNRYLNQDFYHSKEWKSLRQKVILRDKGCDLGIEGHEIVGKAIIHHINPITAEDIVNRDPKVFDMNNVILTNLQTHNAIHYGSIDSTAKDPIERKPNDTCPWRK